MKHHVFIMNTSGRIALDEVFNGKYQPNEIYTVSAVMTIEALGSLGIDVLKSVYLDQGLTEDDYLADLRAKAEIVTFSGGTIGSIRVPASKVKSLPDQTTVPYHEVIISVSLGPMATSYDYSNFRKELAEFSSDISGVSTDKINVYLDVLNQSNSVTVEEHKTLEQTRLNNVKNRTTSRGRELTLANENKELKDKLATYGKILVDNGWIPES